MPPFHWGDFVAEQVANYGELVVGIDPVRDDVPSVFGTDDAR